MEDRLPVAVVRMGLGCAAVLAGAGWAGAQPVALPPAPAGVEVTREQGFEFVTVTASRPGEQIVVTPAIPEPPSNIPEYFRPHYRFLNGSTIGQVAEPFRISRTELTHGQYIEMLNMYVGQRSYEQWVADPLFSVLAVNFAGTFVSTLDEGGNYRITHYVNGEFTNRSMPVNMIEAMLYCNWLHNDRPTDINRLRTGAYDVERYLHVNGNNLVTQSIEPLPGARFFIPSQEQWIRAAHFDPNRYGPGQGGYWLYANGTDAPSIPGIPGVGSANIGWDYDPSIGGGTVSADYLSVGSYPQTQSPWGLLDTSGGAAEITTTVMYWPDEPAPYVRNWNGLSFVTEGSFGGTPPAYNDFDHLFYFLSAGFGDGPAYTGVTQGVRIAAALPAPGVVVAFFGVVVPLMLKRRRL